MKVVWKLRVLNINIYFYYTELDYCLQFENLKSFCYCKNECIMFNLSTLNLIILNVYFLIFLEKVTNHLLVSQRLEMHFQYHHNCYWIHLQMLSITDHINHLVSTNYLYINIYLLFRYVIPE